MKIASYCLLVAVGVSHVLGFLENNDISGTSAPRTNLIGCNESKSDVVFVLDSSGSVGAANFKTMKDFVKSIIQNLDIGEHNTKVGLITFSRYPTIRLHMNDYVDKANLLAAVDKVPYISGITETQSALYLLTQEGFRGARQEVPHIGIVITDGRSFHENQTVAAAVSAQQSGISLFAIGIGNEINLHELNAIASDPNTNFVYTVTDFNSLINISESLTTSTCAVTSVPSIVTAPPDVQTTPTPVVISNTKNASGECNQTLADVVFILDSSGSLGMSNFSAVKKFVINIVNFLDIGVNLTKVGVITFSNYPTRRVYLDQYYDKLALVNAINSIPYYPGNTETDKALDLARLEGYIGGRKDAPDIAIVVTDGLSTSPDLTRYAVDHLKSVGTTVFAIGIGADIRTSELNYIASNPDSSYVFFVANFTELSKIESSVAKTTCEVPLQPSSTVPPLPTTRAIVTPSTGQPTKAPTMGSTTTAPPTSPPTTTPLSCVAKVADIVFLVDASGSVGADNFDTMKQFIKQTIGQLDIGTMFTRVGLITFSNNAVLEFGLSKYNTTSELDNAIDAISYAAGGTNTGAALEILRKNAYSGELSTNPNVAIVITDGFSRDKTATKQQARLAKDTGIKLIAIGIGSGTDSQELTDIASVDENSQQSLVYQVGDFAALQSLNSVVAHVACNVALNQTVLTKPPTVATSPSPTSDCFNAVDNCEKYGSDICYDYRPWAMAHCSLHCGFCDGPSTTQSPCKDYIDNCYSYGTYICTEVSLVAWTKNNCPKYCGFCGNGVLPTDPATTTTTKPEPLSCSNTLDNCEEYGGTTICTSSAYEAWAKSHCRKYCGFCSNVHTVTGVTLQNNQTCPDWILPNECTLVSYAGSCCPLPKCPDGYTLTAKSPLDTN